MQKSMEGFLSSDSKLRKTVKLEDKKRARSPDTGSSSSPKKKAKTSRSTTSLAAQGQQNAKGDLGGKATAAELAEDEETPLEALQRTMEEGSDANGRLADSSDGDTVLYWMRMKDLRIKDNRALAHASQIAQRLKKTLVVVHIISPNDYRAHHRSARRIDFTLRNLRIIKADLNKLNIPLHIMTVTPRKSIPKRVIDLAKEIGAFHLCANIEYEVDELGQLTSTFELAMQESIHCAFMDDQSVVSPNKILTKQGKPYSVFSPWQRNWSSVVTSNLGQHLDEVPEPAANSDDVARNPKFEHLFSSEIPKSIEGFSLDEAESKKMEKWWPAGTKAAEASLAKFVGEKVAKGKNDANIGPGTQESQEKPASKNPKNLLANYGADRSRPDLDGSSRLSPYLAAGVISIRAALRATLPFTNGKLRTEREHSVGMWVQELSWRDFYQHVLAAWPRVCKGKAFQQKYDDVIWEYDDAKLEAWKQGRTGFPLVDAGMRQVIEEDLMMDWRVGERFFMENLIDGDFGSNNGGWQWSAGTGTDPQPYFRIFNPLAQSEKSDPDGVYIKKYIPELRGLSGKAVHEPHKALSKSQFEKLGYPKPIVDHASARKRAIARFKNVGSNADE